MWLSEATLIVACWLCGKVSMGGWHWVILTGVVWTTPTTPGGGWAVGTPMLTVPGTEPMLTVEHPSIQVIIGAMDMEERPCIDGGCCGADGGGYEVKRGIKIKVNLY